MNKELMNLINEFLENFKFPISYERIAVDLEKITAANYRAHECNFPVMVVFEPCEVFGRFGMVVDGHKIIFNRSRIDALVELKIDCFDSQHLDRIWSFYENYNNNKNHTDNEISLYNHMRRYIDLGATKFFAQMGSYKTIKYELIETVLHENQHVFQNMFLEQLLASKINLNESNLIMAFTVVFQKMYKFLQAKEIKVEYVRENHTFPIEFDARYNAMVQMNKVRELYFREDQNFMLALKNSNIIPVDLDLDTAATKIFNDFVMVYKLYKPHADIKLQGIAEYILSNEKAVKVGLKDRYLEMLKIAK